MRCERELGRYRRHAVDFDEPVLVHEARDRDGGARRAMGAEELLARGRDLRAVVHVAEVPVDLDDVVDGRAGAGEDPMDVLEHLRRLRGDVALADERAGLLDGDLTGDEDEALAGRHDRDVRVQAHRGGDARRVAELGRRYAGVVVMWGWSCWRRRSFGM